MSRFRAGDVVSYSTSGEAIVDRVDKNGDLHLLAWRTALDPACWIVGGGMLGSWVEPHPNPDRVLADYTAWRLTHGGD